MKKFLAAAATASAMVISANAAQAECGDITMTEMNWASSQVVTGIAKFILEQGYGCSINMVPSSTVPSLASVAETGEPDIVTELWTNGSPVYDDMAAEGVITPLTDVLSDGGVEGWWVPAYLVEKHPEVGTLEGILANPELVGGRFHQCPEGWGCQRANFAKTIAFGVADSEIEIFQHGSGETLASSIAAAFENEEPWFGYYWAPTAILGRFPMVMIDLGEIDLEVHNCDSDPECADRGKGKSAFPPSPVKTVVTASFAEDHPEEAAFMANLSFTNEAMNSLLAWKEENNATTEETAVYFLQNNSDEWAGWLNDDARSKLAPLIK